MTEGRRRMREKERRHSGRRRPNPVRRRLATGACVTVGATLLMRRTAQAATFIAQANAAPNPSNKITFASGLTGSIDLTAA